MNRTATAPEDEDPVMDSEQAARYLGVSPLTLGVWRSSGRHKLPYEKIGRLVRYRKSALDAFRAANTRTATA